MLEKMFGSKVGVKVLLEIGRKPYREFYLNELSKNLKIGMGRTISVLNSLVGDGVLLRSKSGNRVLYRLNGNSPLGFEVIKFAHMDAFLKIPEKFRVSITNAARKYEEILGDSLVSVVLFGSVAAGRAGAWSDIDIFIVVKRKLDDKARKRVRGAFSEVSGIFSHASEEHIFTEQGFLESYGIGDDFLINVMEKGIILFDRGNFFGKFLLRGIPGVTRKSIEKRLETAKRWLDSSIEMHRKGITGIASSLGIISTHLSRAILLLNHKIPDSKHEIPKQLEGIGEGKLARVYRKTREWFENPPLEEDREEEERILNLLEEKYNECYRRLELWS